MDGISCNAFLLFSLLDVQAWRAAFVHTIDSLDIMKASVCCGVVEESPGRPMELVWSQLNCRGAVFVGCICLLDGYVVGPLWTGLMCSLLGCWFFAVGVYGENIDTWRYL